jgi:hypothetical protein
MVQRRFKEGDLVSFYYIGSIKMVGVVIQNHYSNDGMVEIRSPKGNIWRHENTLTLEEQKSI